MKKIVKSRYPNIKQIITLNRVLPKSKYFKINIFNIIVIWLYGDILEIYLSVFLKK